MRCLQFRFLKYLYDWRLQILQQTYQPILDWHFFSMNKLVNIVSLATTAVSSVVLFYPENIMIRYRAIRLTYAETVDNEFE